MLADRVRPDLVLVEVMPPLLDERIGENPLWMPSERLAARDIAFLKEAGLPCGALDHARHIDLVASWHSRRFVILSMAVPRLLPPALRQDWARACDASGFVPHIESNDPGPNAPALKHAREQFGEVLQSFHLGGAPCQAVRRTLETCRAAGIRAALVVTPEGRDFRSWYPPAARPQTPAFLRQLQQEYGVPVIHARKWLADDDFIDSHHARNRGAEAFSRRLGRDVLPALLADNGK